ncbi:Ig-like domain-containing protein, partial [Ruminococcus sp.]|uniref:Ig-like domain-containing protein n=1 Tax=Ruminococcus sp. TaxID=41978 RepID=UPI0025F022FD
MDNNQYDRYESHRPRKRVSRKTLRNRRLAALFIIAFVVLLFIILIAKGCSKSDKKAKPSKVPSATTITTQATTTDPAISTTAVTTTTLAEPVNESDFKLDKTSVYIEVGEQDTPMVQAYPNGTYESDERWSSGDPSIATVDSYGHIKGISPGVCYVT